MSQKQRVGDRGISRRNLISETLENRTLLSQSWYVSTLGSDKNAGSLTAPFATIQHAADMAHAGDTVYIRGGTYHETVYVHNSGTAAAKIIFQPYNKESVTVDGADAITGWTDASDPIYTAQMTTDRGEGFNQVFVDGTMVNEARWPNTPMSLSGLDLSQPVQATVASATATATVATLNDPNLTQPAGFWDGATLRIAAGAGWGNQTGVVTDSGPGYVTISYTQLDPVYTIPGTGNQYYMYGVAGALDAPGEWFRDPATGTLSLWTPTGDSPSNHVVEVKTRTYGFDLSNASYVRINDIHFFACSINTNSHSTADVINHITAVYLNQFATSVDGFRAPITSGIILAGSNDTLQNSVIAYTAGDGVYVSGPYAIVSNNYIHDTDYAGVDCAFIRIGGYRDTITHNTGVNTGRDGLLFSGNNDSVTYNDISRYGLQAADLGGFYTASYNGHSTVIAYNKFHDAPSHGYGSVGIMLDNSSGGFIIHHNITWNVLTGLRTNGNAYSLQVYNNTFDASNWSMDRDSSLTDVWTNVVFENNIMTHPIQFVTTASLIDNISNHHAFVDAPNGNFYLLPGAAAIDTGAVLPPYTNGYKGVAPDVGALEYGLTAFSTGAVFAQLPVNPAF